MRRFLKTVVGFFGGAICGAAIQGTGLFMVGYLDETCGFLGCGKDWAMVGLGVGLLVGGGFGGLLGIIIGFFSFRTTKSTALGTLIGGLIWLALALASGGDARVELWGISFVLTGAIVGFVASTFVSLPSGGGSGKTEATD